MAGEQTGRLHLLRYGALGVPLAFAGLPVYVHVPKFYADSLQLSLGLLGSILLIIRLCDAFIDPLIGLVSDRLRHHRRLIMIAMAPLLLIGYIALFNPPAWSGAYAVAWLVMCLGAVYF